MTAGTIPERIRSVWDPSGSPDSPGDRSFRPTAVSTGLASGVVCLTLLVVGVVLGQTVPLGIGGLGAVTVALSVWLVNSDSPRLTALGTVCVLAGGTVVMLAVALAYAASLSLPQAVLVGVAATVCFAITAAWLPAVGYRAVTNAITAAVYGLLAPFLLALTLAYDAVGQRLFEDALELATDSLWNEFVFADATSVHVGSFLLLLAAGGWLLRQTVQRLPVLELVRSDQREQYARRIERANSLLAWNRWVFTAGVLAVGVELMGRLDSLLRVLGPLAQLIDAITSSEALRWLLVLLVVGCLGLLLGQQLLGLVSRPGSLSEHVAPLGGGIVLAVLLGEVLAAPIVASVLESVPAAYLSEARELVEIAGASTLVLAASVAAFTFVVFFLFVVAGAGGLGVVPDRAAGIAVASGGLFLASILLIGSLSLVWTGVVVVVAAVLTWDLGEFGIRMSEEVGRINSTRDVELAHAAGSGSIAVLAVVLTIVAASVASVSVPATRGALLGFLGAVVGVLCLVVALRA